MTINKKLFVLGLTLILSMGLSNLKAQTTDDEYATNVITLGMPEVSMLKSNVYAVNLTLSPTTAGNAVVSNVSDSTARVLISSVVTGEETRTMTAKITTGTVPSGTELKLMAKAPNTNFVGTAGTYQSTVVLNTTDDKSIITGIGTCYSGTSEDDGYVMKYTYGLPSTSTDYALIRASSGEQLTVTLTLTAGQ